MSLVSEPMIAAPETPVQQPGAARVNQDGFVSPARTSRVEEKHALATLNHRLEVYILQNREAEANKELIARELNQFKARAADEVERQRTIYNKELDKRRSERDELVQKVANLSSDNEACVRRSEEDRRNFEKEKGFREALEIEVVDLQQSNDVLKSGNQKLKHDMDIAQSRNQRLEQDVVQVKKEAEAALQNYHSIQASKTALEEDLAMLTAQYGEQIKQDRDQIDQLQQQNSFLEKRLRAEFASQLNKILKERQDQYEREKNSLLQELKNVYDTKLAALREKIEQQQNTMSTEEDGRKKAEIALADVRNRYANFDHEKEGYKKQIKSLKQSLTEEKARPAREGIHLKVVVRKMKDAYKRKESEFDSLMDVKIALSQEINAYRMMLENEEARLGIRPAKKRRRDDDIGSKMEDIDDAKEGVTPTGPSIMISSVDVEGGSITIRNCTAKGMHLAGWKLTNESGDRTFEFPNIVISTGASVRVLAGISNEQPDPPHSLGYDGEPWHVAGDDVAVLISPEGNIMSRIDIIAAHTDPQPCSIM